MYACAHAPGCPEALEALGEFSPFLERTGQGSAIADLRGMETLLGAPRQMAEAIWRRLSAVDAAVRVAVAVNPDTACYAARGREGITVVEPGRESEILAPLPLTLLIEDQKTLDTLRQWGLRTFRDLAALPEDDLVSRLGAEAARWLRRARGEEARTLRISRAEPVIRETLELEDPVELLEPLLFLLARQLNSVCAKLAARGLATHEIRLTLNDRTRFYRPPVAIRNPRTFLKLMQLDLERRPPGEPVHSLALEALPADPRVAQSGLFTPPRPEPEKLEITVARIAALVGRENVGVPEILDTHRPDAFRLLPPAWDGGPALQPAHPPQRRLALRRFRPPKPCDWPRLLREAERMAGPWRTCGDWWTPDAWDRDEYDVALPGGAAYRVFRDNRTGLWFWEGQYD